MQWPDQFHIRQDVSRVWAVLTQPTLLELPDQLERHSNFDQNRICRNNVPLLRLETKKRLRERRKAILRENFPHFLLNKTYAVAAKKFIP